MANGQDNPMTSEAGANGDAEGRFSTDLFSESLFEIAWQNRWLIFLSVVVCGVLAVAYLFHATPIYESASRLYVEQSGPRIIDELEEGIMTRSNNYLYTQAELVKSTPILSDAIDKGLLARMRTLDDVDNPVAFLSKNLQTQVGKKDDLITVAMRSPYPREAADIVNAVVDEYITYQSSRKRSTSAEVLKILQAEKAKSSSELSDKLAALTNFRRENVAVNFDTGQGNFLLRQIERLANALDEASMVTLESELFYEAVQEMEDEPLMLSQFVETQGSGGMYSEFTRQRMQLQVQLRELELRRDDRVRQLTPDHPGVVALDTEIAELQQRLDTMDAKFIDAQRAMAERRYTTAKEKEQKIADQLEKEKQDFADLNDKLTVYLQLQSEYEQTKKVCDLLDDRIRELNITEDVGALNISILEVARPADDPSEPQKTRMLALAIGLGLFAGCGLALIRRMVDQRLHSMEEAAALLGTPILGAVPKMSRRENRRTVGQVTHLQSQSLAAEAYRTIRTGVFFGIPKSEARTMLVTSAGPGEGKSTTASNLAIAIAQAGQRVLLIDADFRSPMQNTIFQLNHEAVGLSGVLAESVGLKEAIRPTGIENLDILTSGPRVSNPSELLNSDAFAQLLGSLAQGYDRVVVDSPPVGPVTDSQILASLCQMTILVVNMEKTKRNALCHAYDNLRAVNSRILGLVINQTRQNQAYGYGYGGYGSYGTSRDAKGNDVLPDEPREPEKPTLASRQGFNIRSRRTAS